MPEHPHTAEELLKLLAGRQLKGVWRLDEQPLRSTSSGQAVLFGARDERTDERVVAKIFRPDRAADFRNEVVALRRLSEGPTTRTVPVRDHGELSEGTLRLPFVIMGFAEGVPLDVLLASPIPSQDERLEILAQIADGLTELHRCRVIHRDLKPANIIVRFVDTDSLRPADYLSVKLVDFGISTVLAPTAERHVTANITGTLLYMAPEQRAERPEISCATDLYAFALLARDLLLGEPRSAALDATQALADLDRALPATPRAQAMRDLFATCLATRPEDRLRDGMELAGKLRPLVAADELPPTAPRGRALRLWRRRLLDGESAGDIKLALALLTDWTLRLCGSIVLACLPPEARREAHSRLSRGEDLRLLVEEMRRRSPVEHPAGRAALALLTLRYTQEGDAANYEGELSPDATLLRGTLLDNARDATVSGDREQLTIWLVRLREALLRQRLLREFTLARLELPSAGGGSGGGATQLVVIHGGERSYPFQTLMGDDPSPREPLLIRVNTLGRPDPKVMPVRLSPFALLSPDCTDLLFLSGRAHGKQEFRGAFSAEAVPAPSDWAAPALAADEPGLAPLPKLTSTPQLRLPCAGRPLRELTSPRGIYLLTDAGEWLACRLDGSGLLRSPALPQLPPCAAFAMDTDGSLVVGHYDGLVARLRDDDWEYYPSDTAVLAMAASERGVLVADEAGGVSLLTAGLEPTALTLPEPITDICVVRGYGPVLLAASGTLWAARWPAESALQPLTLPAALGRPRGLLTLDGALGIAGTHHLAVYDLEGGTTRVSAAMPSGFRSAVMGNRDTIWALSDGGEVYSLDLPTMKLRQHRLGRSAQPVLGVRALPDRGALCFTADGELFRISKDRGIRRLVGEGIVLAFPAVPAADGAGAAGPLVLVRWRSADGAQLSLESPR